ARGRRRSVTAADPDVLRSAGRSYCPPAVHLRAGLMKRIAPFLWLPNVTARLEALRRQPKGNVAPRAQIFETDDRGEFDKLRLIKVVAQLAHELVVDGWRCRGHPLGKFQHQALDRIKNGTVSPLRDRLDLFARDAVRVHHPVAEVQAPRAADLGCRRHVGEIPGFHVQRVPLGRDMLQGAERPQHRNVVTGGAYWIEHCAELPSNEPLGYSVGQRPGWGE